MSVTWYWQGDQDWNKFDDNDTLEKEYTKNPTGTFNLVINQTQYIIDFAKMTQINTKYFTQRIIKRVEKKEGEKDLPVWEWESDLGFVPFDTSTQIQIEKDFQMLNTSQTTVIYISNTKYLLDFISFTQENLNTKTKRNIQRVEGDNILPKIKSAPSLSHYGSSFLPQSSYLPQGYLQNMSYDFSTKYEEDYKPVMNDQNFKKYLKLLPKDKSNIVCKNLIHYFTDTDPKKLTHIEDLLVEEDNIPSQKLFLKQIEIFINGFQGEKKIIQLKSQKNFKFYLSIDEKPFLLKIQKVFDVDVISFESDEKDLSEWSKTMNEITSKLKDPSIFLLLTLAVKCYHKLNNIEYKTVSKKVEDKYKDMWKIVSQEEEALIEGTSQYLLKQIEKLKTKGLYGNLESDINVRAMLDNPFLWTVTLKYDEDHYMGKYLKKYGEKFEKDSVIYLEILFSANFPIEDPIIRIVKPRLICFTGGVNHQGVFNNISLLKNMKINGKLKIVDFLKSLKNYLVDNRAKLNMNVDKPYEKIAPRQEMKNEFEMKDSVTYYAFSSQFGQTVLNIPTNPKTEAANNILLPFETYQQYFGDQYRRGYCPTVQIKTPKGIYQCGVLSCETPKSVAVFPNWMFKDMMIEEGTKIEVQQTNLERGKFATFRPVSHSFWKDKRGVENFTQSLSKYSCLTLGQMIQIQ